MQRSSSSYMRSHCSSLAGRSRCHPEILEAFRLLKIRTETREGPPQDLNEFQQAYGTSRTALTWARPEADGLPYTRQVKTGDFGR